VDTAGAKQPDNMAELLSMVFDDDDETCVTAMYSVCDIVLQLKQKPHEGRVYNKEKEDLQEYVSHKIGCCALAVTPVTLSDVEGCVQVASL